VQKLQREAAMRAGKSKIFRKLFAIEDESEELMDGMRFNMHVLDCVPNIKLDPEAPLLVMWHDLRYWMFGYQGWQQLGRCVNRLHTDSSGPSAN